tara:strand:- start:54 stop:542 length:489 start_codon:yes stop_codon:yes gene_type:complete
MKKHLLSLLTALIFTLPSVVFSQHLTSPETSSKVEGTWLTQKEEKNAKIEIKRCVNNAELYCGKIVWLQTPNYEDGTPKVDRNNPSLALTDRPLLGLELLSNFSQSDETTWEDGTIYNPEDGETYNCTITFIQEDGVDKLNVRGYVGFSLFGKTQTWVRSSQ